MTVVVNAVLVTWADAVFSSSYLAERLELPRKVESVRLHISMINSAQPCSRDSFRVSLIDRQKAIDPLDRSFTPTVLDAKEQIRIRTSWVS